MTQTKVRVSVSVRVSVKDKRQTDRKRELLIACEFGVFRVCIARSTAAERN